MLFISAIETLSWTCLSCAGGSGDVGGECRAEDPISNRWEMEWMGFADDYSHPSHRTDRAQRASIVHHHIVFSRVFLPSCISGSNGSGLECPPRLGHGTSLPSCVTSPCPSRRLSQLLPRTSLANFP
ncbi:hypothetical protein F5884DRAFT_380708 [Xylogone sp. PMI_703]|nr:hypothetical protein F5884DRAFT_380708 [Xylogone sp. PMI_703]